MKFSGDFKMNQNQYLMGVTLSLKRKKGGGEISKLTLTHSSSKIALRHRKYTKVTSISLQGEGTKAFGNKI